MHGVNPEIVPRTTSMEKRFRVWAVCSTVAAVFFFNVALFLFLHVRELSATQSRRAATAPGVATNAPGISPFLTLQESDIPGRWRWKNLNGESTLTLYADHTFRYKNGEKLPQYHWAILRDGFLLVWQRGTTRFTVMESPRAFVSPREDGKEVRFEKVD